MAITLDELLGLNSQADVRKAGISSFGEMDMDRNYANQMSGRGVSSQGFSDTNFRSERQSRSQSSAQSAVNSASDNFNSALNDRYEQMQRQSRVDSFDEQMFQNSSAFGQAQRYNARPEFEGMQSNNFAQSSYVSNENTMPRPMQSSMSAPSNALEQDFLDRLSFSSGVDASASTEKSESRTMFKSEQKQKAKLNVVGKMIVGGFVAFVVAITVLVIVNAEGINQGTVTQAAPNSAVVQEINY